MDAQREREDINTVATPKVSPEKTVADELSGNRARTQKSVKKKFGLHSKSIGHDSQ
jgi:hypothetical protein